MRLTFLKFLLLLTGFTASAQVVYLDHEHMDFRILYNPAAESTNQLDIQVRYNATAQVGPDYFYATNHEIFIVGGNNAVKTIPSNPNFAFLGTAGSPIWILPQTQNTTLPFVGVSGEDLPDGVFDGPLKLQLISVEGPGNFFVWQSPSSTPIINMICTNGTVSAQYNSLPVSVGDHSHYNWGFSTNGLYRVTFQCTGTIDGTNVMSGEVAWAFQILPLRPWEQWVSTNWLPATEMSIAGPTADPDGDGIININEYALGLDPNSFSTDGLPMFSFVTNDFKTYGALTFTSVKADTDLIYEPSVQNGLSTGNWEMMTNTVSAIDNGDTETVTVRDSISTTETPARFYQFRVRLLYP